MLIFPPEIYRARLDLQRMPKEYPADHHISSFDSENPANEITHSFVLMSEHKVSCIELKSRGSDLLENQSLAQSINRQIRGFLLRPMS